MIPFRQRNAVPCRGPLTRACIRIHQYKFRFILPGKQRIFRAIPSNCIFAVVRGGGFKVSIDQPAVERYTRAMQAIEFTTELSESRTLSIPQDVAAQIPRSGKARVIVLTDDLPDDAGWRLGAYEQFLRDDAPEDAIYDTCR